MGMCGSPCIAGLIIAILFLFLSFYIIIIVLLLYLFIITYYYCISLVWCMGVSQAEDAAASAKKEAKRGEKGMPKPERPQKLQSPYEASQPLRTKHGC